MGKVSATTEEERLVIRECIKEAFWYRSLPLAVTTSKYVYDQLESCVIFKNLLVLMGVLAPRSALAGHCSAPHRH